MVESPLLRRFPELAKLSHVPLGGYPTPVEEVTLADGRLLMLKRDDLPATGRGGRAPIGGNKIRGLEWLLGSVAPGDGVLTVGPRGSTHALATTRCAALLGARTTVVRWRQTMNPAARRVAALLQAEANVVDPPGGVAGAYLAAAVMRVRPRVHWIPAGGLTPIAVLGHVNAALELSEQVARGECRLPARVVVPLGTGGTAAGLALGFRIAELPIVTWAVRVVPKLLGRAARVLRLARGTERLLKRVADVPVPRVSPGDIHIADDWYGGGYGNPLPLPQVEPALEAAGVRFDDTYSRKALAAVAASADSRADLLWLTFDGRLLQD